MKTKKLAPGTSKVRRDFGGGKRGDGNNRTRRVRRPDPTRVARGAPDPNLTGVAGLVSYGAFVRRLGVDARLAHDFARLKDSSRAIYSMPAQMRLLMDAFAAGEGRVLGLEALACDPLFVHLAGGVVPSLDTVYRDLNRFDDQAIVALESLMAEHGLARAAQIVTPFAFLDIDTSVLPRFGDLEGAVPGPNPKYRGRPSHHPILARVAQLDTIVGALLRPGVDGHREARESGEVHR